MLAFLHCDHTERMPLHEVRQTVEDLYAAVAGKVSEDNALAGKATVPDPTAMPPFWIPGRKPHPPWRTGCRIDSSKRGVER